MQVRNGGRRLVEGKGLVAFVEMDCVVERITKVMGVMDQSEGNCNTSVWYQLTNVRKFPKYVFNHNLGIIPRLSSEYSSR